MRGVSIGRLAGMAVAIPAFIALGLAAQAGAILPSAGVAAASPTAFPTSMRPPLIIPDLGLNASQADYGERAYRLVCAACHGNRGQGLTDEWRSQWPPEDQNCWQSKCHAPNHPPDGFIVPRYVPPVLGPNTLLRFSTVLELHDYIYQAMPWQEPASLSVKEYWDITAYLVRERGVDLIREPLDAARAAKLRLHPEATPAGEPQAPPASIPTRLVMAVAALGLGLGAGLWLVWRRVRHARN